MNKNNKNNKTNTKSSGLKAKTGLKAGSGSIIINQSKV